MEFTLEKNTIKKIFIKVKKLFNEKLGKYTHQRIAGDWHFHGLAFVREEMTYVFGFNVGFFKNSNDTKYNKVGMNVLVRTNGLNKKLRTRYADFFKQHLKDWYFSEDNYSSFRGGEGSEFMRYKNINEFSGEVEIVKFIEESIQELHRIYHEIVKNPDDIFDDVLRAAYPWHDTIIDVCNNAIKGNEKKN